ncbi:MAG: hypothetical protein AAGK97_16945, partial [Bacteroidota bacterium]
MARFDSEGTLMWENELDASGQNLDDGSETLIAIGESIFTVSFYEDRSFPGEIRVSAILMKWNLDGTTDPTFGDNGSVRLSNPNLNYGIFDIQVDGNGRFYLIGRALTIQGTQIERALVIRLNQDGSIDTTFGNDGIYTITWQGNRTGFIRGKIINGELFLAGWYNTVNDLNALFLKVTENGETDMSFGDNGGLTFTQSSEAEYWSLDQHGPNHVLVAGSFGDGSEDIIVRRYSLQGVLDNNFGDNGTRIVDFGGDDDLKSLIVDSDLGIYL